MNKYLEIFIFSFLCGILYHIFIIPPSSISQDSERISGRIELDTSNFLSLYGLTDFEEKRYQDTIDHYTNQFIDHPILNEEVDLYLFLKDKKLLHTPCLFISVGHEKYRVYFKRKDIRKINRTDWINKFKNENLDTYLNLEAKKLTGCIYFCERILTIEQSSVIPESLLELEEDIEIEPYQLRYEEIDSLYLHPKNLDEIRHKEKFNAFK